MKLSMFISTVVILTCAAGVAFSLDPVRKKCDHDQVEETGDIDGKDFIYTGKVGHLHIKGKIDGGSVVNFKDLACGNVTIDGKIDGKSTLFLNVQGNVSVGGKFDGKSKVTIMAKGDVTIGDKIDGGPETVVEIVTTGDVTIVGKVDGGVKLTVTCRNFHCKDKFANRDTTVRVNNSGTFKVDGGTNDATVTYNKNK